MCGIKIPQQDFALKCREGGAAYMRDTTVYTYTANEEQHCPKRVLHSKGVKEDMAH